MLAYHGLEVFNPLERDILFCFAEINERPSIRSVLRHHYLYGFVVIGPVACVALMTC
jgi:hypothetical protein